MAVAITESKARAEWVKLQAQYRAVYDAFRSQRVSLEAKYGHDWFAYCGRLESARINRLQDRLSKATDRILDWLDEHSPRNWHVGTACHWICTELTYDDAVTSGPLSAVPQLAYGMTRHDERWLAHA